MSNVGVGQRWARGNWLVGYNTFYDNLLDENLQRAGFGAEAWGRIFATIGKLLSAVCCMA